MSDDGSALPAGTRLGRYEVQEELGSGTFGNVYRCTDPGGNDVAVREYLPPTMAVRGSGADVLARSDASEAAFQAGLASFRERAERMARIDHPGVVGIVEVFDANGTAYVAMDYAKGRPLAQIVESASLSEEELVRYVGPVVEGLVAMHSIGLVHGSLGLGSIIVDDAGTPMLLGLAVPSQDQFGAVLKPGFAPLERYSANAALESPQTDVYSLGAIVYRCVTGVTPPEAPIRAERDSLVPASRSGARRAFTARLLAAIDAALALDPQQRPGVEAIRDALVAPEAADAAPETADERAPAGARARPVSRRARDRQRRRREEEAGEGGDGADRPRRKPALARRPPLIGGAVATLAVAVALLAILPGDDDAPPVADGLPPAGIGDGPLDDPPEDPAPAEVATVPESAPVSSADEAAAALPAVPATSSIVVETVPAGAEVYLDGDPVGASPLELGDLATGSHRVALRHPGYDDVDVELTVSADGPARIERELTKSTGALEVRATPETAWVEANGERLAEGTPVTLDGIPTGQVEVTVGAPGYRSEVVEAVVRREATEVVDVDLIRALGTLTVSVTPDHATVELLDGAIAYEPGVSVPEGAHRIRIAGQGYTTVTEVVQVTGATRHEVVLEPDPQPLTVAIRPPNANVAFVGLDVEYTPGIRLDPGEYRVEASLVGYAPWSTVLQHGTAPTVHDVILEYVSAEYSDPMASGGVGPVMVVVPAGDFEMGCRQEGCAGLELPVRSVTFDRPLAVSKYEVTFAEYDRCVAAERCPAPDDAGWGRGRRPVVNVSWNDAAAYTAWLSAETERTYRLPSEAEWEYAARAGTVAPYAFGNADCLEANCNGRQRQTLPVGSYGANDWGLHDMHGNVWEWVLDCSNESYGGAPADGAAWLEGDCERRMLRGGSWFNAGTLARSASRLSGQPATRGNIAGFRVVGVLD